jgi:hypothetical protein
MQLVKKGHEFIIALSGCFMQLNSNNIYSYMIISHYRKFIFFEYPKSATSSIKTLIFPYLYREYCGLGRYLIYFGKRTAKKILGRKTSTWPFGGVGDPAWRKVIPQAHFTDNIYNSKVDEYFKFSIVRNPFDKMVSAYKHGAWGVVDHTKEPFEDFVRSLLPGGIREIKYLTDPGLNHFVPWTRMFDMNRTDFIMRFENIDQDIKYVKKKIKVTENLEKLNISRKSRDYRSYYTQETRAIVAEIFKKDLEVFGYCF